MSVNALRLRWRRLKKKRKEMEQVVSGGVSDENCVLAHPLRSLAIPTPEQAWTCEYRPMPHRLLEACRLCPSTPHPKRRSRSTTRLREATESELACNGRRAP
eukprot:scaffold2540_cov153-Pinguiococcus_pyrenoidosus.AAC.3